jgi:hypothetical protein
MKSSHTRNAELTRGGEKQHGEAPMTKRRAWRQFEDFADESQFESDDDCHHGAQLPRPVAELINAVYSGIESILGVIGPDLDVGCHEARGYLH